MRIDLILAEAESGLGSGKYSVLDAGTVRRDTVFR
jgi:hypothetical protein